MVRIKHRYLLFNILYPSSTSPNHTHPDVSTHLKLNAPSPSHLNAGLLINHLRSHIVSVFGDYGLGLTTGSLRIVYFSQATSTAIIRCPRQHFRMVWAAFTFMVDMPSPQRGRPGIPCVVRVVRVSGTIRKSEEELMRRARKEIVRARLAEESGKSSTFHRLTAATTHGTQSVAAVVDESLEAGIEDPDKDDEILDISDDVSD